MNGKYFSLQFNRSRSGEPEFEAKLREMAKDNNLTLCETVMALVMAVDHFKVSYNVDLELNGIQETTLGKRPKKPENTPAEEQKPEIRHNVLDAILNK